MRKLEASAVSRATFQNLEQLELTFIDGTSVVLGAMKDRDEAFNTIIGFSALQWQVSKTAFMWFWWYYLEVNTDVRLSPCNIVRGNRDMVRGIDPLSPERMGLVIRRRSRPLRLLPNHTELSQNGVTILKLYGSSISAKVRSYCTLSQY